MRIIKLIQCRRASTRLPDKAMLKIGERTIFEHVLDRCYQSDGKTFLVTTKSSQDTLLKEIARGNGVTTVYRGEPYNVFLWFKRAAWLTGADWIIRVCGDSPFVYPDLIDKLIQAIDDKYDYIGYATKHNGIFPASMTNYGIFCEAINCKTLDNIPTITSFENEHVGPAFYCFKGVKCKWLPIPKEIDLTVFKLTVDTAADYIKISEVYSKINLGILDIKRLKVYIDRGVWQYETKHKDYDWWQGICNSRNRPEPQWPETISLRPYHDGGPSDLPQW